MLMEMPRFKISVLISASLDFSLQMTPTTGSVSLA
jgi:hypothetical protein